MEFYHWGICCIGIKINLCYIKKWFGQKQKLPYQFTCTQRVAPLLKQVFDAVVFQHTPITIDPGKLSRMARRSFFFLFAYVIFLPSQSNPIGYWDQDFFAIYVPLETPMTVIKLDWITHLLDVTVQCIFVWSPSYYYFYKIVHIVSTFYNYILQAVMVYRSLIYSLVLR